MNPKGINGERIPRGSMIVDPAKVWGRVVAIAFVVILLALAGVTLWLYRSERRNTELLKANRIFAVLLARTMDYTDSLYSLNLQFTESGKLLLLEEGPRAFVDYLGEVSP